MLWLLLALLAAAAVVAWRTFTAAPPSPGPVSSGTGVEVAPRESDPTTPGAGAQDAEQGTRVVVTVTAEERFLPPAAAPVVVQHAGGAVLPVRLLGGVGAQLGPTGNDRGFSLVSVELGGARLVRRVSCGPEVPAVHTIGAPATVSGKVVDAAGKPIAGATVWVGELGTDGALVRVATDDEGAFTAQAAAGSGVPFVVQASGHASSGVFLDLPSGGVQRDTTLAKAVPVTTQLAGIGDLPVDARLFVVPLATVSSELSAYPFFLQSVLGGIAPDAQGRASLEDLPAHSELGLVVAHPRAAIAAPRTLQLRDRALHVPLPMVYGPAAAGRVVDGEGTPIPGARVLAGDALDRPRSEPMRRLMPTHVELQRTFAAFAAADGTFAIGRAAGPWRVEAPGFAGRLVEPAETVVLPRWHGGACEFELALPAGLRDRAATWLAGTNLGGGVQARLSAQETWRIALPHAGRFSFVVETFVDARSVAREEHRHVDVTGVILLAAPAGR